jgi:deoxyadenosine/deoxycytidine kinase
MPRKKKTNKVITVIGPISSGKTTASQLLAESLKLPLLDADLFEENPFLPNYIKDNSRWSFATELFFTIKRIKKLEVLPKMLTESSVVVDSGLIMSHQIYTKNHLVQGTMTASEWDFFSEIINDYQKRLPHVNVVVQLLAKPKTQIKRISDRGRSFEKHYTLEYLQSITDRIGEYTRSLDDIEETRLVTFDTDTDNALVMPGKGRFVKMVREALR